MLSGLEKAKALKEFKQLRQNKAHLKGLALAKSLKRMRELRVDLGMTIARKNQQESTSVPQQAYQLAEKPTITRRQKDNAEAVALMRELQQQNRQATDLEKIILSKYTGTGGNLIGENGLKGSAYEYYTPIEVASTMWHLLKESGFKGGAVLDPSTGTGIFNASAPKDEPILMHSIELSEISGNINALINDSEQHAVTVSPFEKIASTTQDAIYDAVITNVPFGDTSARGENRFFDKLYQKDTLEEYFIKRSLDKLKPNGLAMFIVPTKILEGKNYAKFRRAVLLKADLLGAYRLPNKVFEATGADVTTDIVLFKKFSHDVAEKIDNLATVNNQILIQAKVLDKDIISGKYFATYGKDFVLGTPEKGTGRYGEVERIINHDDLANILKNIKKLPDSRIDYNLLDITDFVDEIEFHDGDVRVIDNTTFEYKNGIWQPVDNPIQFDESAFDSALTLIQVKPTLEYINKYIGYLANTGRKAPEWLAVLLQNSKDDRALYYWTCLLAISEALKTKTNSYESRYPVLTKAMIGIAPSYFKSEFKTKNTTYKSLQKTIAVAFDAMQPMGISHFWKHGDSVQLDNAVLSNTGLYENVVYRGLADNWQVDVDVLKQTNPDFNPLTDDDFCINADGTKVTLKRDYYVGNYAEFLKKINHDIEQSTDPQIKEKLLKQKAHADSLISYTNVYAMSFSLMSSMIPFDIKYRFFNEFVDHQTIIDYKEDEQRLAINAKNKTKYNNINTSPEQDASMRHYLLNRIFIAINNKQRLSIIGEDTENQAILTKKLVKYFRELDLSFNAWLKTNKDFMRDLNHQFNAPENKSFPAVLDGSMLEIDNFKPKHENFIGLHDYQNEEVRRLSRLFSGICGFDVGLGKTLVSLATIQNMHNIGIKKRTFIIVPNHTISKWTKDIHHAYTNIDDVLVIGTNENQLDSVNAKFRSSDFALLTTEQGKKYRKILMTVEAFVDIPMREDTLKQYFRLNEVERTAELEKQKGEQAKIIQKLNKYASKISYFEDMQVDSLVFDEAQLFKNGMAGGSDFSRIKGIAQKDDNNLSIRALSSRAKSWYVRGENQRLHGLADGVVLLTATPFTNSPVEIMTMLSLAIGDEEARKLFGGQAIRNINDFLSIFAHIESLEQKNIVGDLVAVDTFTGFRNVELLKDKIHQVANIQTAKERGLKIPSENHVTTSVDLPESDKLTLDKMKLFYQIAKAEIKNESLINISPESYADYLVYKEQTADDTHTIGHAFSLINRMAELTLVGEEMALSRNVVLDFDPEQIDIAKKVMTEFNAKKMSFKTTRKYPLGEEFLTTSLKKDKNTGDEILEYIVKAQVSIDEKRHSLILNVDNATVLARLMQDIEKAKLIIKPKLSAKVSALMENVNLELSTPKHQNLAKQLIFCDVLSMHQIIKQALICYCNIPASQIAILNAQTLPDGNAGSPDTEHIQEIQDKFADNHYTIVIANKKAETGIDLQRGTQAIHHLTTGWTPDSLQQRNGRGVRQGNNQEIVTIYTYNASGTFDEYKRQLIDGKADWIGRLMSKQVEIQGVLNVNQELSQEDYEDLINADSPEKIAELLEHKKQREEQQRKERIEAKNHFILNNMLKARQNAKNASFNKVLQDNILQELNKAIELARKKGGNRKKRDEQIQAIAEQFNGIGDISTEKVIKLIQQKAESRKGSRDATLSLYDVGKLLENREKALQQLGLSDSPSAHLSGPHRDKLLEILKQQRQVILDKNLNSPIHQRVANIINSALEMQHTTQDEYLNNNEDELSREDRQLMVEGKLAIQNNQIIRDLTIFKYEYNNDTHYILAQVSNNEITYHFYTNTYPSNAFGKGGVSINKPLKEHKIIAIEASERKQAIDYMVNADFGHTSNAYHDNDKMKMSNKLVYANLLTEVYNQVQAKINEAMGDYLNEEVKLEGNMTIHKQSNRLYGSWTWWEIFKMDNLHEQAMSVYYQPFSDIRKNDDALFVKRSQLNDFTKTYESKFSFYNRHLKPFLIANNLKLNLVEDFKQSTEYQAFSFAKNHFFHSDFEKLGIKESKYATQADYDVVLKKVANYLYGDFIANTDELVEKLGLNFFDSEIKDSIIKQIGKLSLDGRDPKLSQIDEFLSQAKDLALPNRKGVLMVALMDKGWQLKSNKEELKMLLGYGNYEWNRNQSAWYVSVEKFKKLLETNWFDFDNFYLEKAKKYDD